jgi:hypothetical protein
VQVVAYVRSGGPWWADLDLEKPRIVQVLGVIRFRLAGNEIGIFANLDLDQSGWLNHRNDPRGMMFACACPHVRTMNG